MRLIVLAIGQRQPAWVDAAWGEFAKRFPTEMRLELKALKAEPRVGKTSAQCLAAEGQRLQAALLPGCRPVALDERGACLSTVALAQRMRVWRNDGRDVAFLIGGPDGLADGLKDSAAETMRLSDLTLPHGLARVLLAEALYRAWTVTTGHPYHRE